MTRSSSRLKGKKVDTGEPSKKEKKVVVVDEESSNEEDTMSEMRTPINLVEGEGDGGEEEVGGETVWTPNTWASSIDVKDIEAMREKYSVPGSVTMRAPEEGDTPGRPRPGEVAFCRSFLLAGVRLPLKSIFREFLHYAGVAPFQINPNVWKAIIGCFILWRKHFKLDISLMELLACFSLKNLPSCVGAYYATAWNNNPILKNPVDAKVWKYNWFFVGGSWSGLDGDSGNTWKVRTTFAVAETWDNPYSTLSEEAQNRFRTIFALSDVERNPKSLITDASLLEFGLASHGKAFLLLLILFMCLDFSDLNFLL